MWRKGAMATPFFAFDEAEVIKHSAEIKEKGKGLPEIDSYKPGGDWRMENSKTTKIRKR